MKQHAVGEQPMKIVAISSLIAILFLLAVLPVEARVNVKSTVDDSILVSYSFENLDPIVYNEIKANQEFNGSTIPQLILQNLERQNLKFVRWQAIPQTEIAYDNDTKSVKTSFYLGGLDIISSTTNSTTMNRMYKVRSDWRKFTVRLAANFSIDFANRLAKPLAEWEKTDSTTFNYENIEPNAITIAFSLSLPAAASRIQVQEDTITYDMPARLEDKLINSPFLILGAIVLALIIVIAYRKLR